MPDSSIGTLPQVPTLGDDSLMVVEQQGQAMHMTGAQLKDYAKQGVEMEFQDYLDEAQEAAESATGAVQAVTDMTVEAHQSDVATVQKSMKNGVNHLDFGLPRGAAGPQGPAGETGPRGPKGDPGSGLQVKGYYDTLEALEAAQTSPEAGDAYGVGTEAPYEIYVFDGVSGTWKNNGPISGGGGGTGPLPENVVTADGGAELAFEGLGDAPQVVKFTDEEDDPLTASDIEMADGQTVQEAVEGLFTSVSEGKSGIASAITDKGVDTAEDATFEQMATNIRAIQSGADTADATAEVWDILSPKTAYTAAGKVTGTIPSLPARTIIPGTSDQVVSAGQYLAGAQVVKGSTDLTPANIRKGVTLFGVDGAMESSFKATLAVTVDIGAEVTATLGETSVTALCTTGTVALELPIEGSWTVTAQRGVTQYNSVVVVVSSSFSASLTAELHIEYYQLATSLYYMRSYLAAATVGEKALFAGGQQGGVGKTEVESYNKNLVHETESPLSARRLNLSGAANTNHAIFCGGVDSWDSQAGLTVVDAYDGNGTRTTPTPLSESALHPASASIGEKILVGGLGVGNVVNSYDSELTRTIAPPLVSDNSHSAAASNSSYVVFAGGTSELVTAYNENLTRVTPTGLSSARNLVGVQAGNYILFGSGISVDAYDLFLTRTTAANLSVNRSDMAAVCLKGFAVFAGGIDSSTAKKAVDVYDPYLTHTTPKQNLQVERANLAATVIDKYALFGGGGKYGKNNLSSAEKYVEVYQYV